MSDRKYDAALTEHLIGNFLLVVLDALDGAGVEASANVWANGTTQLTLKGDRTQVAAVLGAWADALAELNGWGAGNDS